MRKVQKYDNGWKDTEFETLQVGDLLRMYESDGDVVKDKDGKEVFEVLEEPTMMEDGNGGIKVKGVDFDGSEVQ